MLAPATVETVLELAARRPAGSSTQARAKLGIGGDVASTVGRPPSRWPRRSPRSTSPTTSGRGSSTTSSSPPAIGRQPPIETLVAALVPLYFGRVGSFVIENRHMTTDQAEERVERQAREFELLKPYLVERWQAAERRGRSRSRRHEPPRSPLPARILIPVANPRPPRS